jgi:hypothetical protein
VAVLGLAVVFRDRWLPPDPGPVVVTPQPSQSGPGPGPVKDEPVPTTLIARLEDRQGLPVDDADVSLNPGNVVAPGAGDGQYLFESVLPGTYTLTARHRAFKERTVNLDVAPGGVRQVLVLDAAASTSNVPLGTSNRSTAGVRPQLSGRESSSGGLSGGPTSVTGRTTPPDADRVTPPGPPAAPGPSGPMGVRSSVLAQDALDQAIKALTQDGDVDRAERLLTEAKRLDPESKDVAKEIERVREIRATERRQKVREFVLRAQRLFREAGDLDAALREVENALNLLPSDPQAVALREEILRVKAIGAKKPPPVDVFRSNEWNTNDATTWSRG